MNKRSAEDKRALLKEASRLVCRRMSKLRHRSLTDLYYFTRTVLGYHDLTPRIHRPLCSLVQSVNAHVIAQAKDACTLNQPLALPGVGLVLPWTGGGGDDVIGRSPAEDSGAGGGGVWTLEPTQNSIKNSEDESTFCQLNLGALEPYTYLKPGSKERGFFLFRGSFKTTIISVAHTIQLMLLWPDIRVLINSHKKEGGSQEILGAIKRHFIGNPRLRSLFPEACPKPNGSGVIDWGTTEKIIAVNRSASCAWPEATVEIAGLTTDVTGRHYDYIKNDDLVTRDSVTNEIMLSKTRQFKALQKFLFNQPEWGITDNVGTFYHFADLNVTLSKSDKITRVTLPAVKDDQLPPERWEPLVPERFTAQGLHNIKTDPTMNSFDWSAQYMMNPVPPEDQTFKPEWLERLGFFYEPAEIKDLSLRVEIYIDPAARRKKTNDYTAVMVIGTDVKGMRYLLDAVQDKLGPEDRTNLALDVAQKWNRHQIHYETIGFQDTDRWIIEKKARERKFHVEVIEVKASAGSKEDRIRGLQPLYERGLIRWPRTIRYHSKYENRSIDMIETLRDQMLMFPRVEHDDLLDCHAQMLQAPDVKPGVQQKPQEDTEFERVRKIMIETKAQEPKQFPKLQTKNGFLKDRGRYTIPFRRAFR